MRRTLAAILISFCVTPLQAQQYQQVECRDLAASGNYLAPNETVINGKACRPAGTSLQLSQSPTNAPAKNQSPSSQSASANPSNVPTASPETPQAVPPGQPSTPRAFVLEDATPIHLVLSENLTSASAVTGQTVEFEVVDDVIVGNLLVIPRGSTAWATVTDAEHKKHLGRGGKLDLNIDKVRLADGEKALLRGVKDTQGGGHTGAMTGAIVATSLVVWPAAPFFLFMHGKDITIPKGTQITAFTQGDVRLDATKFEQQLAIAK